MNYLGEFFTVIFRPLRPLRPFDFAQDTLCARYPSFGCGFAALGPLWLIQSYYGAKP
jgi:hypothetical protein